MNTLQLTLEAEIGLLILTFMAIIILNYLASRKRSGANDSLRCGRCSDRLPSHLLDDEGYCSTCAVAIREAKER